jgi:signal transduction histidine kinase
MNIRGRLPSRLAAHTTATVSQDGHPYSGPASWTGRAERVIAVGRALLALSSLVTIWLDPGSPARYVAVTYALLATYAVYAVVVAVAVWFARRIWRGFPLVTHLLDLALFTGFIFLTDGVTSPLFAYFVFAILCGRLRWQWRGAALTAIASLAAYICLGLYAEYIVNDPASRLDRFILRASYLTVIGGCLISLGAYEQRIRTELQRLARWPRPTAPDEGALLRVLAESTSHVLAAPRVVILWQTHPEGVPVLTIWPGPDHRNGQTAEPGFLPLVAPWLGQAAFLSRDVRHADRVLASSGGETHDVHGQPLNTAFVEAFGVSAVLALPLVGASGSGWLLCLDKRHLTADDLEIGGITAREVVASIEHAAALTALRDRAVQQARTELGRDLHDGLLQSLTAARLQLHQIGRNLRPDEASAVGTRLATIESTLSASQRELRLMVDGLRQARQQPDDARPFGDALAALRSRMRAEWDLEVTFAFTATGAPAALGRQLVPLLQEALVNAARHGRATHAEVHLHIHDAAVHLAVRDNGGGFPFKGRRTSAELTQMGVCPASIRDRVARLGGSFEIDSPGDGSLIEIRLPIGEEVAHAAH